MNANATTHQPGPRRNRRVFGLSALFAVAASLALSACWITEVVQPAEATQGQTIDVTMTVEINHEDQQNAWKGVTSVLVPEDWTLLSGTYTGDLGSGDMVVAADWADSTEIVLPAPTGMKWVSAVSDRAYNAPAPPSYMDATLRFRVGQAMGTFNLGYFTTTTAFKTGDISLGADRNTNTADTLMNKPILIRAGTANEAGPADGRFVLEAAAPNPARASATIGYRLAESAVVNVAVYDATGRRVALFAEGRRGPGAYEVRFDAARLPGGVYLYRLEADGAVVQTRRMAITK